MTNTTAWSLGIWGGWMALFLVLELLGLFRAVPWVTLSETVWTIERFQKVLALVVAGGLFALILHFAFRWPEQLPV